ncbi:hypothetical protein SOPP22_14260 [Shewanella sp. OPT22]|nr:hypothetical protein SOPP22_14260 [Shewanella sp. OPT22]
MLKSLSRILSIFLQTFILFSIYEFLYGILLAFEEAQISNDPRLIAGQLSVTILSSTAKAIIALIGFIIGALLLKKCSDNPKWFKNTLKLLSYCWLFYIPIGTYFGVKQLK